MNTIDRNISPYLQMPLRSQEEVLQARARRARQLAEAQAQQAKAPAPAPATTTSAPQRVDESV